MFDFGSLSTAVAFRHQQAFTAEKLNKEKIDSQPLLSMEVHQVTKKTLTHLPERPAIDISFQDLCYKVPAGRAGSKVILKEIAGSFKAGQLAAIMGPSGAGKSTLLNVLAGYKGTGISGVINVNGNSRDLKQFHRISRYIMQEDVVQPHLTVQECMQIAAEFKLGSELSNENKSIAITEVLSLLNLLKHKDTKTNRLSGGERKRLSIAQELVDNPPVIFLDEPTTGLDYTAGLQCVSLLKTLAQGGRTVVCSIHTPSAKMFALFDHVYILSQGQCVFQGLGSDIVPFLQGIGLPCPTHYNPADFVMDVAAGEYGCHMDKMVALTDNGRAFDTGVKENAATQGYGAAVVSAKAPEYGCSTWRQFLIILRRMHLQLMRNVFLVGMLVLTYLFIGVGIAGLFYDIGNNAAMVYSIICFFFCTMLAHAYCSLFGTIINFSLQADLLKREHFNRWYSLEAYFLAATVYSVPQYFLYSSVYTAVVLWPVGQPMEMDRILKFMFVTVMINLISETLGLCIAICMKVVNAMFMAVAVIAPLSVIAAYSLGPSDVPRFIQLLIRMDYLRYVMEGLATALYENRDKLPCPDGDFCLYTYIPDVMKFWIIVNTHYWQNVVGLLGFYAGSKLLNLYLLRRRFSPIKIDSKVKLFAKFLVSYALYR